MHSRVSTVTVTYITSVKDVILLSRFACRLVAWSGSKISQKLHTNSQYDFFNNWVEQEARKIDYIFAEGDLDPEAGIFHFPEH